MRISVKVRPDNGVTVVTIQGSASDDLLATLGDGLSALGSTAPLVVDLSEMTLSNPADLRAFLDGLGASCHDLRLTSRRLTAREAIRRCTANPRVRVFASVDEAAGAHTVLLGSRDATVSPT